MPAGYPPIHPHPGKPVRTIRDAARDGQLMILRCRLCRRCVHFLAADLVEVVEASHPCHIAPFGCSKCGSCDYVDIQWRSPAPGDIGTLLIRRPVGWKRVWKTVRFGDGDK
ncbi:hypothetical protein COL8621_00665 [Actibacterium lipolyticum]|uniref:Uncharacterized protein n=1 Tax=Actibacterium lipolyticum TaxID=1524263 RepID=A0A238JMT9_9RHOB|nr:hypothetical protein COL8621_00665 [Actibacterium lipolyticum]